MAQAKRRGRKKQTPIISNTGFIGSVFIDTLELQKKSYIGIVPNMSVIAKFNADPVICKTYNPSAKLYIELPNIDTVFAIEYKQIFLSSWFLFLFSICNRKLPITFPPA